MGNSKTLAEDGDVTVVATSERDDDAAVYEADCYSPEDIRAWEANQWEFHHVSVRVLVDGEEIGSDGTGGVEDGRLGSGRRVSALEHPELNSWALEAVKGAMDVLNYQAGVVDRARKESLLSDIRAQMRAARSHIRQIAASVDKVRQELEKKVDAG